MNEIYGTKYPSIVDEMVTQGLINQHTYSLWLDDLGLSIYPLTVT